MSTYGTSPESVARLVSSTVYWVRYDTMTVVDEVRDDAEDIANDIKHNEIPFTLRRMTWGWDFPW